jgi:hypothetical protein
VITDDRWVPENVLLDELDILQRDASSVKSMKVARNELARRLAQKRIYFDRELSTKTKPPQPFPTLDIKSFYYLSRHGPIVQKSISLHAWCRLCIALDSDSDSENYQSDESIIKSATEYTGNILLTMSQLIELAPSLLANKKRRNQQY